MSTTPPSARPSATVSATLTVSFNGRFWEAVLEHHDGPWVRAARAVLGAEPTDPELYAWLLAHGAALSERADRAPRVRAGRGDVDRPSSPKRAARQAARAAVESRPSTAAQAAVKAEQEARAQASTRARREDRDAERERRRLLKRARAKQRHRGR